MQQCLLSYDNNTTLYAVMVRLKCLLGGKDTVMVDWSVYNDGSGFRDENDISYADSATIL